MSRAERDMSADAGGVRLYGVAFSGEAPLTCCIAWTPSVSVPVLCESEAAARSVAASIPTTPSKTLGVREYIAHPAAQAAAMEAVVLAAREVRAEVYTSAGHRITMNERDSLRALSVAVDAYLATLPRAHGGEGGGA